MGEVKALRPPRARPAWIAAACAPRIVGGSLCFFASAFVDLVVPWRFLFDARGR
jgi:hypothetical protein